MSKVKFKFNLGDRLRDRSTGFVGIVEARMQWLNGCIRYQLQGPMPEGKQEIPPAYNIDEGQLVFVDEGLNAEEEGPVTQTPTGGPRSSEQTK